MLIRPSTILEAHDDYFVAEVNKKVGCFSYSDVEWLIIDEVDKKALDTWGLV